jgi:outer membrane protein N
MQRKVLALMIPALLMAGAAHAAEIYNKDGNKLDLYGKVDGLHYFSDDKGADGDQTYMRLGFKGETQINNMMTGYAQWEYNIQANNTEGSDNQSWTRLAFAGVKVGDYGSFDYGRNYGVLYDVEGWTDMLPEFGGDSYTKADNFMTGRANGVATYRNTDFYGLVQGLNFALQYQGKNDASNNQEGTNNGRDTRHENGDGFGISTTYDFGMGISAGAAYTSSDRSNDQVRNTTAGGDKADAWTAGLKYDANNIYLATMYSETRNMTPTVTTKMPWQTKHRTLKLPLNISSTLVCVRQFLTCSQKAKTWVTAKVIKTWLNTRMSVQPITSTKTCLPMLIIKSTCWTKMTRSTKTTVSVRMIS